jgi:hypothetical protein
MIFGPFYKFLSSWIMSFPTLDRLAQPAGCLGYPFTLCQTSDSFQIRLTSSGQKPGTDSILGRLPGLPSGQAVRDQRLWIDDHHPVAFHLENHRLLSIFESGRREFEKDLAGLVYPMPSAPAKACVLESPRHGRRHTTDEIQIARRVRASGIQLDCCTTNQDRLLQIGVVKALQPGS